MLRQTAILLATGLLLGGAVLALFLTACHFRGYEILTVQSNSMMPAFKKDDAVLVSTRPSGQFMPGQVVSYRSMKDDRTIISHRIIRFDTASGMVTTKGDDIKTPDPVFSSARLVGWVIAVLPRFGLVLKAVRQPAALAIILYLPAVLLIANETRNLAVNFKTESYTLHRSASRRGV